MAALAAGVAVQVITSPLTGCHDWREPRVTISPTLLRSAGFVSLVVAMIFVKPLSMNLGRIRAEVSLVRASREVSD
jgi:hypothetical protein